MNKWIKILSWFFLIPIGLILLVSILLYIPPIQDFAVRKAAEYATEATGMKIGIKKIRLDFPLNFTIDGVEILSDAAGTDTILAMKHLGISIKPLPLLKQEVLVKSVDLQSAKVNTGNLIDGLEVKGMVGRFYLVADRVKLGEQKAVVNNARLEDSAITLLMGEPAEEDTTASEPVNWNIGLEYVGLENVSFALQMPSDTLRIASFIKKAALNGGEIDLGNSIYKVGKFTVNGSTAQYDASFEAPAEGLDFSHIALSDIEIDWRNLIYAGKNMDADLRTFSFSERSGLRVDSVVGLMHSDNHQIHIPDLKIRTAHSKMDLTATVPWKSLDKKPEGNMQAVFTSSFGKEDLLIAGGNLSTPFVHAFPEQPLEMKGEVEGNMDMLYLNSFDAEWDDILSLQTRGIMQNAADEKMRNGEVDAVMTSHNLDFLKILLSPKDRQMFNIPRNMELRANARVANGTYEGELSFIEGRGVVSVDARYTPETESYSMNARIDSLEPIHFMPQDSLMWLTAEFNAEGKGTDIFKPSTSIRAEGKIKDIVYGKRSVSDVNIDASLKENFAQVDLVSRFPLAEMDITLNATLKKNDISAMLIADMQHIDLHELHLTDAPLFTSFQIFAEASTDTYKKYDADFTLGNWEIETPKQTVRPKSLVLKAHSDKDTTTLAFHAGDLGITLSGGKDIIGLADQFSKVMDNANMQMERDSVIKLYALRPLLPDMKLEIEAKRDNPVFNYLQMYYVEFDELGFVARTSPKDGLSLNGGVFRIARDTFEIDTVRFDVRQDTVGIFYNAQVVKHRHRKQLPFKIDINGQLQTTFADALLRFADGRDSTGVLLGARIGKDEKGGMNLHLFPEEPVIAFRKFKLNPDNYISYHNEKNVEADFELRGENNAALRVYSVMPDSGMTELHAELNQIDLDVISKAFPTYVPPLQGLLNADMQYVPSDSSFMVVSGMSVDSLHYDKGRVGDLLMNLVYLPMGKDEHQVDMHMFRDGNEIVSATASYNATPEDDEKDDINGNLLVSALPIEMLNAFIPDGMAKLSGLLNGELNIAGHTDEPDISGFMQMDTAKMYIAAANSSLTFDNKKINIKDYKINFNKYSILSAGKNPFVIDGNINFENPSSMVADLKLTADNMQLLNAKRTKNSMVYGKIMVDMNSTVKGPLESLVMRGNLNLLGGSNFTYVLTDSPLTVQDRLSGLVTFTSFAEDSLNRGRVKPAELKLGGLDMLMTVHIDQAVQINVDLTPDQSSHINLEGGGDLSFQYTPMGDMLLNGRYTLSGGTVKYSLPVIPLKEFKVHDGSYVQWTGDIMDPTLNLTATERIRTSVAMADNSSRMVNFDVGISLTERLENLGLKFILDAPEDASVQEQLARMGDEERSKQAVSMLVTGMYLAGGSTAKGGMNMGSALNSFLQSEINNIIGSQSAIDINLGMESYDNNGDGTKRTDYSFRFAKRFYNDRISVILGGRISTGEDINRGQAQPFIDNVSVEYRLDRTGTRYVKLFHNKDYESLLEGELTETGAGIVLRKKMQFLRELFDFRKKKKKEVTEEEEKEKEKEVKSEEGEG